MAKRIKEEERDGDIVYIYDNGMEWSKGKGHIIKPPDESPINKQTAREFNALWRQQKEMAKLRGLCAGAGIEIDDIEADLIQSGLAAAEIVTAHMTRTFLSSKNLRGMGETYTKLMQDSDGDTGNVSISQSAELVDALTRLVEQVKPQKVDVIDAE